MEQIRKVEMPTVAVDEEHDEQYREVLLAKALAQKAIEGTGQTIRSIGNLTLDDVEALKKTYADISVIDTLTLELAQESIDRAYETANLISLGVLDPLSA